MKRASEQSTTVSRRFVTVPNALCVLRIVAAPFLLLLAHQGRRVELLVLVVLMALSDWLDGRLATLLDQRSEVGPALDSAADLVMYGAFLGSVLLLEPDLLETEWPWLMAPVASYLAAGLLSLLEFSRWPSHHTRMAKVSWLLVLVGVPALLLGDARWPLRLAMVTATLANLQSMAITFLLPSFETDVISIGEARRLRQCAEERAGREVR